MSIWQHNGAVRDVTPSACGGARNASRSAVPRSICGFVASVAMSAAATSPAAGTNRALLLNALRLAAHHGPEETL